MQRKTDIQMAKLSAGKRLRGAVRMELNIKGDELLNDLLPDFGEHFDAALAQGTPFELIDYRDWVREAVNKRVTVVELNG